MVCTQVFRGKKFGDDVVIKSAHTPDWWLVPKDEEEKYLSDKRVYEPRLVPNEVEMPPLLSRMYEQKLRAYGKEVKPDYSKLFLRIRQGAHNRAVKEQSEFKSQTSSPQQPQT